MEGRIGRGSQEPNHQPEDQTTQIPQASEERHVPQPSVLPDINNDTEIDQRKRNTRPGRDGGGYPHLTGPPRLRASEHPKPEPVNIERLRRTEMRAERMRRRLLGDL